MVRHLVKKVKLTFPTNYLSPQYFFSCVHPFLRLTNENGISIINISTLHAGRDCINGPPSCEKVELIPRELFISPVFFHAFIRFYVLRSSDPVSEVYLVSSIVGVDVENLWLEAFVDVC